MSKSGGADNHGCTLKSAWNHSCMLHLKFKRRNTSLSDANTNFKDCCDSGMKRLYPLFCLLCCLTDNVVQFFREELHKKVYLPI